MDAKTFGPAKMLLRTVENEMELLGPEQKHWFCGGRRTVAAAVNLLKKNEIIAIPTDTIYGFAGRAENVEALEKLYEIKKRDESKPLAICLSNVNHVDKWAITDDLPDRLLVNLLPGPVTIVLKRKPSLNPRLNPGIDSVGIRVSKLKLITCIADVLKEPLALTSANESNDPSTLSPEEFKHLWPLLGGIFHDIPNSRKSKSATGRAGSTIIDLSEVGKYKILRNGVHLRPTLELLRKHGLTCATSE